MGKHYRVGIDLATKKIGVVVSEWHGDKLIEIVSHDTIVLTPFSIENMEDNMYQLDMLAYTIEWQCIDKDKTIFMAIELGNYGNASLTCKFAFYAGMLLSYLRKRLNNDKFNWKIVSPHEWQQHLTKKGNRYLRSELKKLSRMVVRNIGIEDHEKWTEDECDAFTMIYFYSRLNEYWSKEVK